MRARVRNREAGNCRTPNRATFSRTSGSTVPRSSPTITALLRTLSSARMRTRSSAGIPHVSAVSRVVPFRGIREIVEPEQPHHMIDAQSSAVPHRFPQRFRIQPVTVFAMLPGIRWRERPVLPGGRKLSGGAIPTRHPARKWPVCPEVAARSGPWPEPDRDKARSPSPPGGRLLYPGDKGESCSIAPSRLQVSRLCSAANRRDRVAVTVRDTAAGQSGHTQPIRIPHGRSSSSAQYVA